MRLPSGKLFLIALCALTSVLAIAQAPQNVVDALKAADKSIDEIAAIPADQRTFDNTLGAFDWVLAKVDIDTSLTVFMQFVSPNAEQRASARAADELVSEWFIGVTKREDLYRAIKEFADKKPSLEPDQQRLLDHTLRDYKRAGMMLTPENRARLQEIEVELSKLSIEFETNIAEDPTKLFFTKDELKGVPESVLGRLSQSRGLYMIGMDGPTYGALQEHCEVALTRQKAWMAHKRRAAKNVALIEKIIKLRDEASDLLGYANRVDYEIETRMAENSKAVAEFYAGLRPLVRKKAIQDMAEFTAAKRSHLGDYSARLNVWDYSFYKNKLLKERYAVDSEKVAEFFPMEAVVKGLFDITSQLYGIEYRDVTASAKDLGLPLWHEDVRLYEIYDTATKELLGRMYTDLYPRDNKYNHAACWGLQPRRVLPNGTVQKPLTALVCNFTKPTADRPSLLPHDEVETFFHEFGHGLHNVLTQVRYASFSGASVERDFVEAPSQMMENWVWNKEVLAKFSRHYQTGAPLPDALLDGMLKARRLGSGIETEFQFFLGQMDQAFHTNPTGSVDTTATMMDVFSTTMLYEPVPLSFYHASFGHLTGYQGAYYGYMWSLVYAQDMFQRFEELGVLSPEAGKYYRDKVLGRGGSMDAIAMLVDYLGREPKMDAFLKHLGLSGGK